MNNAKDPDYIEIVGNLLLMLWRDDEPEVAWFLHEMTQRRDISADLRAIKAHHLRFWC